MSSLNLRSLISQVKTNCNISDAKFWGFYSLCGLLMRFRELYRQENGMLPWEHIEKREITEWISRREYLWSKINNDEYIRLSIGKREYDPFDTDTVNTLLEKSGIVYGAGLGLNMKPSFFLAELLSKDIKEGYNVYSAGRELARDISAYPAMLQAATIFVRRDPLSHLLWERFEELKTKRRSCSLSYAFSHYAVFPEEKTSEEMYRKILHITEQEAEMYMYHEIGEAFESERLGRQWKSMLLEIANKRTEQLVRSIKDILADTSEKGLLRHIIENHKKGSLGFYVAFLGGLRRLIFPEILYAFDAFSVTNDWEHIEKARKAGYQRADELAMAMLTIQRDRPEKMDLPETIEKKLL